MTLVGTMADWPSNDELIAEQLRVDPEFREAWERTSIGRAVATALVRYRTDHDVSQHEIAERLSVGDSQVARLELGETNLSVNTSMWLSTQLGIQPHMDVAPSASDG
jgi:ribosome-binding protein aMBF1 (putative translation factor)